MRPIHQGPVTMKPDGPRRWILRYIDPITKRDVRRAFNDLTQTEAEKIAQQIYKEILNKRGFIPDAPSLVPTIDAGLAEAIKLRNTIKATTDDRTRRSIRFVNWLRETYPAVRLWSDMRPVILQAYVADLQRGVGKRLKRPGKPLAHASIRLDIEPVLLTWRHMAQNYPEAVRTCPRINLGKPPRPRMDVLTPEQVMHLLDDLRAHGQGKKPEHRQSKALHPILALMALAGLRVLEAGSLRRQDVDLDKGLITITETPWHKPKNADSHRTIPVCSELREILAEAIAGQKIIPPGGEIFLNKLGNQWRVDSLSSALVAALKAVALREAARLNPKAQEEDLPKLAAALPWHDSQPHRLRSFFATSASRLGAHDRILKAYIGHAAGDVLGTHYRVIDLRELRTISSAMDRWRTLKTEADEAITAT